MRQTYAIFLILATWFNPVGFAQQLNHFDVLFFQTSNTGQTWTLKTPRFLTAFNPVGYNNQPAFFSNTELYLTVQTPDDTTQTDIYALDLSTRQRTRITATTTAEYSPTPMPGGKRFSAVRVEDDGRQRLWTFPMDRSDTGTPAFSKIYGVGYHAWVNDTLAALFIVGENATPHTLYSIGTKGQRLQKIASNVGRSLHVLPDQKLAFVQKATEQTWFLKIWDFKKQSAEIIVKMPSGTEDFAVFPDGTYIAGNKSKIFQYKPGRDADWKESLNLSTFGVRNITRIAVNKEGHLAIVVE